MNIENLFKIILIYLTCLTPGISVALDDDKTPTMYGCGIRSTIYGTDNAFKVDMGYKPHVCVITFHSPWLTPDKKPYIPICVASNESSANLVRATDIRYNTVTITGITSSGDKINVICAGYR